MTELPNPARGHRPGPQWLPSHEVAPRGPGPPSRWAANPFVLANRRGRSEARRRDLDPLFPRGPRRRGAGSEVPTAPRSVRGSSNTDGPSTPLAETQPRPPRGRDRPAAAPPGPRPRPARARVLTWRPGRAGAGREAGAQARGGGLAPADVAGWSSPGRLRRERSRGSASPGNAGGPAGRQEAVAEEEPG